MARTKIEWTKSEDGASGYSWNPVVGCTRVSAGCEHCYAERQARRIAMMWMNRGLSGFDRYYRLIANFWSDDVMRWHWNGKVSLFPERLDMPMQWKNRPRRVFVCSMSDLFHPKVPDEFIAQVFATMILCPQHTFLVLSKRPERMRDVLEALYDDSTWERLVNHGASKYGGRSVSSIHREKPFHNVWLGVSCENQETADERIPLLLQIPAPIRFVSAEPLLGPVDLTKVIGQDGLGRDALRVDDSFSGIVERHLDWVIVGGESGVRARPCEIDWVRSIVQQCHAASVACFVKQLGRDWVKKNRNRSQSKRPWQPKGEVPEEWPEDLRVREWPQSWMCTE